MSHTRFLIASLVTFPLLLAAGTSAEGSFIIDGQQFNTQVSMASTALSSFHDANLIVAPDFQPVLTNAEYGYEVLLSLVNTASGTQLTRTSGGRRNSLLRFAGVSLEFEDTNNTGPFALYWNDNGFNTTLNNSNPRTLLAASLDRATTHTIGIHYVSSPTPSTEVFVNGSLAAVLVTNTQLLPTFSNVGLRAFSSSTGHVSGTFAIQGGAALAVEAVPEPSSSALGACGLLGLLGMAARVRRVRRG
ncbi:MAG: PEP-CTERM sorting domain-containing protein [Planctomycetes bacterium]|nr:PEP-CTERM sorting domain-containing protein [Planctomycetota bacterium]